MRRATQLLISTVGRALACPRSVSIRASAPARRVAEEEGRSAAQYPESAKWASQAALFPLVSVAHDQETPAVSSVARSLRIWGRNWGIANAPAAVGAEPGGAAVAVFLPPP